LPSPRAWCCLVRLQARRARHPNTVGKYGGTLRGAALGPEVNNDLQMIVNTGLLSFSNDLSTVTPVVATSYEMSPDDKMVTFKLRKGIKWSDGQRFTANDIVF
jgi:peptide/nickel transport system substrate-binding protein